MWHRLAACTAAFLLAALVPAIVVAWLSGSIAIVPYAFGVALAHALLLALPPFVLLSWAGRVNLIWAIGVGFLVGAGPLGLLAWPLHPGSRFNAWSNGTATVIDGVRTAAGWLEFGQGLLLFGSLGALAGLTFWTALKLSSVLPLINAAADLASLPRRGVHPATTLAAFAVLATTAVAAIPTITKDRTCHNMFRDGRASIGPRVNIDLQIGLDEWARLTKLLEDFAAMHGLSFRNLIRPDSPAARFLYLSLCNERGTSISVVEQYWHNSTYARPSADRGISIPVYEVYEGSDWQELAGDLIAELEATWPGRVRFRDPRGRIVPKPAGLEHDSEKACPGLDPGWTPVFGKD